MKERYQETFVTTQKRKWKLAFKILPIILIIFLVKLVFHQFNIEYISLNALFTSLIATTTFLIGFLITGVISDYKESEKIPGDLAASLESLYGEAYILDQNHGNEKTKEFLVWYQGFVTMVTDWFTRRERTKVVLENISRMDEYFVHFEPIMQANFLTRMKNEQASIRRSIIRVDNIRDMSFIPSAYAIAEILATFVIVGLMVLKIEPFYEALFFTLLVSFIVVYMIFLIKDLDNPFDYQNGERGATEVSLKPLYDMVERIKERS